MSGRTRCLVSITALPRLGGASKALCIERELLALAPVLNPLLCRPFIKRGNERCDRIDLPATWIDLDAQKSPCGIAVAPSSRPGLIVGDQPSPPPIPNGSTS